MSFECNTNVPLWLRHATIVVDNAKTPISTTTSVNTNLVGMPALRRIKQRRNKIQRRISTSNNTDSQVIIDQKRSRKLKQLTTTGTNSDIVTHSISCNNSQQNNNCNDYNDYSDTSYQSKKTTDYRDSRPIDTWTASGQCKFEALSISSDSAVPLSPETLSERKSMTQTQRHGMNLHRSLVSPLSTSPQPSISDSWKDDNKQNYDASPQKPKRRRSLVLTKVLDLLVLDSDN